MKKIENLNCILLIDDDEATNFIHKYLIESQGIDVHVEVVLNGKEALDFILSEGRYKDSTIPQPGILFVDINMPVMDGWEFVKEYDKLQEEYKKGKVLLVMLTTSLNSDDKKKAETLNCINDFYSKPLTAEMLNRAIVTFEKNINQQ